MNVRAWNRDLFAAFRDLAKMENGLARLERWPVADVFRALIWHKVSITAAALAQRAPPPGGTVFSERIRQELVRYGFKRDALRKQLGEIADAFRNAGLEFVLLKGPVWGARSYPTDVPRHLGDVDVLVRREAKPAALAVLHGLGYEVLGPAAGAGAPERVDRHRRRRLVEGGDVALSRPGASRLIAPVELHWEPLPTPRFIRRLAIPAGELLEGGTEEIYAGIRLTLPPAEVRLVYLALHAACQHQFRRFLPLLDMAYLLRSSGESFDWGRTAEVASRWNAGIGLYGALLQLDRFGGLDGRARDFLRRAGRAVPWWGRAAAAALGPPVVLSTSPAAGYYRRKFLRMACSAPCALTP